MINSLPYINEKIAAALIDQGLMTSQQIERARQLCDTENISLDRAILQLGLLSEVELLRTLSDILELPFLEDVTRLQADPSLIEKLGIGYLRSNTLIPIDKEDRAVRILTSNPTNQSLLDEVQFFLGEDISVTLASSRSINILLENSGAPTTSTNSISQEQSERDRAAYEESRIDGPIIKLVSDLLDDAVERNASDIHFSNNAHGLDVRFRLNGVLVRQSVDQSANMSSVFARLKVMAGMNVAERRKPQDGRLTSVIGGRVIDFRASSLPTQLGESIVLRILDPKNLRVGWDKLGLEADVEQQLRKIIAQPSGMFVVTGPTGSGKTTTLYALLEHLKSEKTKIITIEDPVEYKIDGVEQVQVHEEIGLTFGSTLRFVLRQDPNIIMVGEIRDAETAEVACRAALMGRLVLTTLHTNTPQGAVTRLKDLGVDEFIVKDVLRGVLGQELEIVSCSDCSGSGCGNCEQSGTAGRRLRSDLVTEF